MRYKGIRTMVPKINPNSIPQSRNSTDSISYEDTVVVHRQPEAVAAGDNSDGVIGNSGTRDERSHRSPSSRSRGGFRVRLGGSDGRQSHPRRLLPRFRRSRTLPLGDSSRRRERKTRPSFASSSEESIRSSAQFLEM